MATTSQEYEAQLAQLDETIDRHRERDREINNAIGAALADGEDAGALRDERREIREALEDLHATRPHLERRLAAARKAEAEASIAGALARADQARGRAVELAAPVFAHIRDALAAVAEVERLHHSEYHVARSAAAAGAKAAGQREPARDFILPATDLQEWAKFAEHLRKMVEHTPRFLKDGAA